MPYSNILICIENARIGRSAIIKTGVALCAPKKRNTETDVPSRISEDPAVDASF